MQILENLKIKEKVYVEKLPNGLTVMIIPKNDIIKAEQEIFKTKSRCCRRDRSQDPSGIATGKGRPCTEKGGRKSSGWQNAYRILSRGKGNV